MHLFWLFVICAFSTHSDTDEEEFDPAVGQHLGGGEFYGEIEAGYAQYERMVEPLDPLILYLYRPIAWD